MKTVTILAMAAVALSLGCSDRGQLSGPELAKGRPPHQDNPTVEEGCMMDASSMSGRLLPLCQDTDDPAIYLLTGNNPKEPARRIQDRKGLVSQLNRAETKCDVDGDAFGAIGKLTEFRNKVLSLTEDGKMSEEAGNDLAEQAYGLITDLGSDALTCPSVTP
ncbi:MAG: hypothetical protein OER90_07420 [Gemmatimonadota bacterium]|nr:hypothetical protein [Gemmatimonadota bacterium]